VNTGGGTHRTSYGSFAPSLDLGERIGPSSASFLRETFYNVEDLNDARAKHGKRRVLGEEAVLADSGQADEISAGVWRVRKATISVPF